MSGRKTVLKTVLHTNSHQLNLDESNADGSFTEWGKTRHSRLAFLFVSATRRLPPRSITVIWQATFADELPRRRIRHRMVMLTACRLVRPLPPRLDSLF